MFKSLIDRVDIYLIILVLLTTYTLVFSDVRYFSRENNEVAKKQSFSVGIGMLFIVGAIYIIKLIWF